MAFTFDATVGGTLANSYVTVSEADDYFTAHLESSFWAISTAQKQAALVMATDRINAERFGGEKATGTQKLAWPRMWIPTYDDPVNPYVPSNAIPDMLKKATFEMALHYLKSAAGEFSVDDRDLETLSGYKLGPMDFKIKDGYKADRLPTKVANLLLAIGVGAWSDGKSSTPLVMYR